MRSQCLFALNGQAIIWGCYCSAAVDGHCDRARSAVNNVVSSGADLAGLLVAGLQRSPHATAMHRVSGLAVRTNERLGLDACARGKRECAQSEKCSIDHDPPLSMNLTLLHRRRSIFWRPTVHGEGRATCGASLSNVGLERTIKPETRE